MKNLKNNSRREWFKKGALAAGALALTPIDLWSATADYAHGNKQPFMFNSNLTSFKEFTPPRFPDLSTVKARLVWNENPYGPSLKASKAFQEAVTEGNHYSWRSLGELVGKIAQKEGVTTDNIMMGPGSSDLLEKTALVYFRDGGNVISGDPCYMSLVQVAKASGGNWKPIKLTKDFQHDLDAMEAAIDADTKLVYITNPNNPTGTLTDTKKLYDFCDRVSDKVPIFIDEAYIELSEGGLNNSMAPLVAKGKNVFVARTFSKIYGMAGLRIGYMLGNLEVPVREKIGITVVHISNGGFSGYGPGFWGEGHDPYTHTVLGYNEVDMSKMIAELGIHTERVSEPSDIVPALNRALEANRNGVPSYIEFICSQYPVYGGWISGSHGE